MSFTEPQQNGRRPPYEGKRQPRSKGTKMLDESQYGGPATSAQAALTAPKPPVEVSLAQMWDRATPQQQLEFIRLVGTGAIWDALVAAV
jgi:hypothetical protein